ncbi:hypothetical protein BTL_4016 [Burkholderia thailandensis H0587]|nr:hypothetical protein BTL_4016 [Burkholderia thailandensis H0587]
MAAAARVFACAPAFVVAMQRERRHAAGGRARDARRAERRTVPRAHDVAGRGPVAPDGAAGVGRAFEHDRAARAPVPEVVARLGRRSVKRRQVGRIGRGRPVDRQAERRARPRPAAFDPAEKTDVQLARLRLQQALLDDDARVGQARGSAPRDLLERIARGDHDARDARRDERVRARRRPAEVRAGLERHVRGCAARAFARFAQRVHFRVRFARAAVPARAERLGAARDHAADARVRMRRVKPLFGEPQRMGHVHAVDVGERAHRRRPVRSVEGGAYTACAARGARACRIDGERPRRPALDPAFIATPRGENPSRRCRADSGRGGARSARDRRSA